MVNSRVRLRAAGIFLLALVVRGAFLYFRLVVERAAVNTLGGSDVAGWLGMARHLAANVDFSYWLMGARPPLYPASVALVYRLGGSDLHAVILQMIFGALTVALGYLLSHRLLVRVSGLASPERLAVFAGIVMALDPASVFASVTLMSEPLFNLVFVALLLSLARFVQERHWRDLALGAIWMALAMLTRPTAIYIWLAAPIIFVPLVKKWRRPMLALAGVGLTIYLAWSARNLAYHGVFTYSLQTNFSLLFLRAISAEHLATQRTNADLQVEYVQELYRSIGDEESARAAVPDHMWKFLVAEDPRLYAEMRRMALRKLVQYWPYAVLGTGIGVARLFGITRGLPLWFMPVEILYHVVLYSMTLWGAWQAYRSRNWELLAIAGMPILYIAGLTLISQTSAMDTRMRTPISVPLIIFAVYGLSHLAARIRSARRADT